MRKSEYPQIADTLGKKIRKKRMDLKLNLLDVAKQVGITESYLSRIEADKQIPTLYTVIRIAKFLKEDLNTFLDTPAMKEQASLVLHGVVDLANNFLPPEQKIDVDKFVKGHKPQKISKQRQNKVFKSIDNTEKKKKA